MKIRLILLFIIILLVVPVSAAGDSLTSPAYALSGYVGDETSVFAPDNDNTALFPLEDDSWDVSGLVSRSGVVSGNGITCAYAVPGGNFDIGYTEFVLDLSSFSTSLTEYSTLRFGIALFGQNDIDYSVETSLYSDSGQVTGRARVGVGWNLFCLDISALCSSPSHLRVRVEYTTEIPASVRITSPCVTKTAHTGFEHAKKYLTASFDALEGMCSQSSGKIFPENKRAVLEGRLVDYYARIDGVAGEVWFELAFSRVGSGSFTLGVKYEDRDEIQYSKKISLGGGECTVAVPMTLDGVPDSFVLVLDNIEGPMIELDYVKIHQSAPSPAASVPGIGSLSKITRAKSEITFTGSMERAAISSYSKNGDGYIRFYALPESCMDDLSRAYELGCVKLTTVFEYTASLDSVPENEESCMFFAAVKDGDGNILPLSRPRFPDASSSGESHGTSLGLLSPATVGAFEANVSSVIIDVPLGALIAGDRGESRSVPYSYTVYSDGESSPRSLSFDLELLDGLDTDIAFYSSAKIKVYLRLLPDSYIADLTERSGDSYAFAVNDGESRAKFIAVVKFLSRRYPAIKGFVLGENVVTSYSGSVTDYVSSLATLCRLCYNAASDLNSACVILPVGEGEPAPETLTLMLGDRITELGAIPLFLLFPTEDSAAERAMLMSSELDIGGIGGIMYLCTPTEERLREEYALSERDSDYTGFTAEYFTDLAAGLRGEYTAGVFFSMEETGLKNSHDFYSALKHSGDGDGNVSDTAAHYLPSLPEGGFTLCGFSDKYHTDGWVAGGGVESCATDVSGINGGERVLTVQFRRDGYGKTSGASGIALYNLPHSLDMSKVDSAVFRCALTGSDGDITVVFVIGTDETRAEYYADGVIAGREYVFSCPLDEYEGRSAVDYIGVMVYSDSELRLELSSVTLYSAELGEDGIAALLEETDVPEEEKTSLTVALTAFAVCVISCLALVFLTRYEREEREGGDSGDEPREGAKKYVHRSGESRSGDSR